MKYTETSFRASARGIFLGLVQEKEEVIRKAFTMLELVFVIVVVGILSVMIAPNFQGNNLRQAADQVVSHIRYTQHLAMMDNKFDPNDSDWYRHRWQLNFMRLVDTEQVWSYTIFSDINEDSNPNVLADSIAINPLNPSQFLSGGASGNLALTDSRVTEDMILGNKYGIEHILFSSTCTNNQTLSQSRKIYFDNIGRPMYGTLHNSNSMYELGDILQAQCIIQICTVTDCTAARQDEKIEIAIEPETGYAHIL